ncbi:MAG: long-chain fatty acid--CoA ligase [Ruminococcaceae bacterium]|nr:long-chain fatty acid--CoA ligase [Oscillospiraceae bacterium]
MNFAQENKKIHRPWIKYYSDEIPADLEYPDGTMYDVFLKTATEFSHFPALDYMNTKISYRALHSEILRSAKALKKSGISRGDRVTVCLPNIPQAVIIFYAIIYLGAHANMIHPLSSGNEIEFYVNTSKSKLLFILDAFYGKTSNINCPTLEKTIYASAAEYLSFPMRVGFKLTKGRKISNPKNMPKNTFGAQSWNEFLGEYKNAKVTDNFGAKKIPPTDTAVILYSGGTTGIQKGIMLSHLNFNALALQTATNGVNSINPGDTMLAVLPMFHGFGLGVCIHTAILKGCTIILVPQFNADSFAKLLRKKKPSFIAGVPTLYEALLRNDRLKGVDFSKAKGIFAGGDTLPYDIKIRFDEALKVRGSTVTLREGFGLTECVTASALTPSKEYRKGSVGIPYSDTFYKIVTPGTTEEVPANTNGEICISGPSVMNGYLDNEEETSKVLKIHNDGRMWLHTGDLGAMDEDGFIYFKSRIKRMIKCSGYSIYPSQIEEIINSHEAVALSCVIGVHDDYKMNKIKAFIVLKNDLTPTQDIKQSIEDYCKKNIARYSLPKEYEYRKELPLTKVGKVAYTILEEQEMSKNVK